MDRRLAAEVRAVEEGHHALRITGEDESYLVISDTEDDVRWKVDVIRRVGVVYFKCTCHAGRRDRLCKHSQLVARRLERDKTAELKYGSWVDLTWEPAKIEDPFAGLEDEWDA